MINKLPNCNLVNGYSYNVYICTMYALYHAMWINLQHINFTWSDTSQCDNYNKFKRTCKTHICASSPAASRKHLIFYRHDGPSSVDH